MAAVLEKVLDDCIARLPSHWIRILKESSSKNDDEHFENRVVLNDAELPKAFRPEEIALAERPPPNTSSYTKEDEKKVVHWRIGRSVIRLEERKLSSARGVEHFQDHSGPERTEKSSPEHLAGKVGTNFLKKD